MKIKHYIYMDNRKDHTELKQWFNERFESPESIEVSMTDDRITLYALSGNIEIEYLEVNKPLIFDDYEFEELRDYHVEYTIGDKVFSSKTVDTPWSKKRIAEVALVHYVTSETKVFKQPITNLSKQKIKTERELLKTFKTQKTQSVQTVKVKSQKRSKRELV